MLFTAKMEFANIVNLPFTNFRMVSVLLLDAQRLVKEYAKPVMEIEDLFYRMGDVKFQTVFTPTNKVVLSAQAILLLVLGDADNLQEKYA